ncbi:succinylglutamate desuccinylase/aspartoacylase family protein [Patescibacteria group bacterium]|nr:succinylglutamate desuccinylase/aspartoacylase family protein [Patescibacteria group bacterium]
MKHLPSLSKNPLVTIVCCLHGDEQFGAEVFSFFASRQEQYPGVQLILAHEEAMAVNKRFLETDLNRSFPGSLTGSLEEQLATEILPLVTSSRYVLDIHTTTSLIEYTPIVTCLSEQTIEILRATSSNEIAFVQMPLGVRSLIGQIVGGVSLEFNEHVAGSPTSLEEIVRIVDALCSPKSFGVQKKEVFFIDRVIPKTILIPDDTTNFLYCEEVQGYPFLLHEKSYPTIHGLCASFRQQLSL